MTVPILAAILAPSGGPSDQVFDAAARERAQADRLRDQALLTRVRGENVSDAEQAFAALFASYTESLARFAMSYTRDMDIAREIVSDVFVNVWERRAEFEPPQNVAAYFFGAVRNRAHNAERGRRRRERLASAVALEPDAPGLGIAEEPAEQERAADHALLVERVRLTLDALSPARREAMVLRWEHQMTPEQIAEVMGITRTAVYHLLERARQALRDLLGPDLT